MVLVQILLPAPGTMMVAEDAYARTRAELLQTFAGVTAYLRSPGQGNWIAPNGRPDQDDIVMVEVVTETFDREWWSQYSRVLAHRFDQEAIHVRAIAIQLLDPLAS